MKILLIGGNGKVGTEIINKFCSEVDLTVICRKKLNCDYQNLDFVKKKLDKYYNYIINLIPFTTHSIKKEFKILRDKFDKYIYFSSFAVYKESKEKIEENSKLLKKTDLDYINRKLEYENFLKINPTINSIIIRPTHIYNEFSLPSIYSGRSNTLINFIKKNKKIISPINWKVKRNFISAKNIACKLEYLINNESSNKIFNFSSSFYLTWEKIFNIYFRTLGLKKATYLRNSNLSLKKFNTKLYNDIIFDKGKNLTIKNNYLTKKILDFDNKNYLQKTIKNFIKKKEFTKRKYYDKELEKYLLNEINLFSSKR